MSALAAIGLLLAACGGDGPGGGEATGPAEAKASESAASPALPQLETPQRPSHALLYVSEDRDPFATLRWEPQADDVSLSDAIPGSVFPAAPDPRGTHALLISAEETEDRGHQEALWLVPLGGGVPFSLVALTRLLRNPAWSPDGSWIAFESDSESYRDLYRIGRDGQGLRRLTAAPNGSFEPAVSPDGTRIAFGTSRDGNAEVYVMAADGTAPERRTHHDADDLRPRWSPDGQTLAWLTHREGVPRVWLMGADGADPRPLRPLEQTAVDLDLAWSPDGRRLAVVVQTSPTEIGIELIDVVEGTVQLRLDGPGVDEHPAWSADGTRLAFTSSRSGNPDIWIADVAGGALVQATEDETPQWLPRWVGLP